MTPQHIKLIRTSFASVRSITHTAAAQFYGRLFELDPSLRCLFHGNMRTQGRKLMAMLEYIVAGLHRPETIMPAVQEAHYATVGTALLWALRQGLGPQCIPAVEAALAGATLDPAALRQAAALAAEGAQGRGHNDFKIELMQRAIVRAAETAGARA